MKSLLIAYVNLESDFVTTSCAAIQFVGLVFLLYVNLFSFFAYANTCHTFSSCG